MIGDVKNKRCIVTGAGSGLGRAMTLGLAQGGALVIAADINTGAVEDTLAELNDSAGRTVPHRVDLTRVEECENLIESAVREFGGVDVLVNCAGLNMALISRDFLTKLVRFWDVDAQDWQRMFDVNVRAPFMLAKCVSPIMTAQGWGRIINVTTSFGTMLREGNTPYGPAKAALEAASAGWAQELQATGVTCNVLIPGGAADTPMIPPDAPIARDKLVPVSAMLPPLIFLASDRSDAVSGIRLVANRWRPDAPDNENMDRAGAPIGWPYLAASSGVTTKGSVAAPGGA